MCPFESTATSHKKWRSYFYSKGCLLPWICIDYWNCFSERSSAFLWISPSRESPPVVFRKPGKGESENGQTFPPLFSLFASTWKARTVTKSGLAGLFNSPHSVFAAYSNTITSQIEDVKIRMKCVNSLHSTCNIWARGFESPDRGCDSLHRGCKIPHRGCIRPHSAYASWIECVTSYIEDTASHVVPAHHT